MILDRIVNLPADQYENQGTQGRHIFCTIHSITQPLLTSSLYPLKAGIKIDNTNDIVVPFEAFRGRDKSLKVVVHVKQSGSIADDPSVIGTASVDLNPLLIGFRYIEGWYNIEDIYSKGNFGQIKVTINPIDPVSREIVSQHFSDQSERSSQSSSGCNFLKRRVIVSAVTNDIISRDVDISSVFRTLGDVDGLIQHIQSSLNPSYDKDNQLRTSVLNTDSCENREYLDANKGSSTYRSSHLSSIVDNKVSIELEDGESNDQNCNQECLPELNEDAFIEHQNDDTCLLDSFDVTMETDCLSDTISDITQLLKDVKEQSSNIDKMFEDSKLVVQNEALEDVQAITDFELREIQHADLEQICCSDTEKLDFQGGNSHAENSSGSQNILDFQDNADFLNVMNFQNDINGEPHNQDIIAKTDSSDVSRSSYESQICGVSVPAERDTTDDIMTSENCKLSISPLEASPPEHVCPTTSPHETEVTSPTTSTCSKTQDVGGNRSDIGDSQSQHSHSNTESDKSRECKGDDESNNRSQQSNMISGEKGSNSESAQPRSDGSLKKQEPGTSYHVTAGDDNPSTSPLPQNGILKMTINRNLWPI